jgi:FkbM family methyltransferase
MAIRTGAPYPRRERAYHASPMPGLDRSPLAAEHVNALAGLLDRQVVAVDVGSRDGVRDAWRALKPNALLVGFDPDPVECARLNAAAGDRESERYEPFALGERPGRAVLNLTRDPQSSSLYPPNPATLARYPELWRHQPVSTEPVELTTIDAWAASAGVGQLDALKVDVQGAELDVLRGGQSMLAGARIVEAEVEFQELYSGQPLFCDVVSFMREQGLELWRLRELHHCGLAPAGRGEPVFGVGDYVERTRLGGQLAWGNAVFVRGELAEPSAPADWQARTRDACLASIFGFPELVELALSESLRTAPAPASSTIQAALAGLRRRGRARRLEDLISRAPTHLRGFLAARVLRRA